MKSLTEKKRTPSILMCRLTATSERQIIHVKLGGQSYVCVAGIIVSHSFQSLRHLQSPQVSLSSARPSSIAAGFVWSPTSSSSTDCYHKLAGSWEQLELSRLFPSDSPFPVPISVSLCPAQPILNNPDYFEVSCLCVILCLS